MCSGKLLISRATLFLSFCSVSSDCCDGSDEASSASLLSSPAVGYRPYFPFFPFSSSFPYAPDVSAAACPDVCEKEASEWRAAVKESTDALASVESLLDSQQRRAEELLQRRLKEETKVEHEIERIHRVIDCKWLEAEAKKKRHKTRLHDTAAVQKAVQRAVVAAKGGEHEQKKKEEEDLRAIEEAEEIAYCEKLLRQQAHEDALERRKRHGDKEASEDSLESPGETDEEGDDEFAYLLRLAEKQESVVPGSKEDPVVASPIPHKLQEDARAVRSEHGRFSKRGGVAADREKDGGSLVPGGAREDEEALNELSGDDKQAARVAQKARAAREAAVKAFHSQQMKNEKEEEPGDSSVSPTALVWDSVWAGVRSTKDRVVAAVQRGLQDMGLVPGEERKRKCSLFCWTRSFCFCVRAQ